MGWDSGLDARRKQIIPHKTADIPAVVCVCVCVCVRVCVRACLFTNQLLGPLVLCCDC
jgi:hypothetical protein